MRVKHWYREEVTEGKDLGGAPPPPPATDFNNLLDDDLDVAELELPAGEPPEPPAPTSPPATPSAPVSEPTPTPAPTPPSEPVAAPLPTPANLPVPPAVATPAPPPPPSAADQQAAMEKAIQEYRVRLQDRYKLPDEVAVKMQTEPEVVLPELLAQVHMQVMQETVQEMVKVLPRIMQNTQETQQAEAKADEMFYAVWPGLKGHKQQVLQVGALFRAANPKATTDEAIERIGQMTALAMGMDPQVVKGNAAPPPASPAPSPTAPRRPAGQGSVGGTRLPPSDNFFTALANEGDDE